MRKSLCVLALCAASVTPAIAAAETYYVATDGDDDNNTGLEGEPWATLQHAAENVAPGDTVIVEAGNYAGFHLETSGTADDPIVFHANEGVTIDEINPVTDDGINLEGASFVTVEGFSVVGTDRAGIRAVLCEHVTIRDNVSQDNYSWGILTGFCDDLLIENNETSGSEDEHGIYVSNSGDRPVIRHNLIHDNNANGIHMNGDVSLGGDGIISEALVEGNVIYGNGANGGSGINCDGVQDSRIVNNLIYDTHASGISLYQIDGGGGASGNVVVNNTVLVADDGRWALNIQDESTGNTVYNNILYSAYPTRGSIDISPASLSGFVSDYNILMDRMTNDDGGTYLDLAGWQADTGQDEHSLVVAPADLFVDIGGSDYHLAMDSDAIGAGTETEAPNDDLDGNARPYDTTYDIGAYEYCGDACVPAGGSGQAGEGGTGNTSGGTGANGGTNAGAQGGTNAGAQGGTTGAGANPTAGGTTTTAGTTGNGASGNNAAGSGDEGGCGCTLPGHTGTKLPWALALAGVLLSRWRRRAKA